MFVPFGTQSNGRSHYDANIGINYQETETYTETTAMATLSPKQEPLREQTGITSQVVMYKYETTLFVHPKYCQMPKSIQLNLTDKHLSSMKPLLDGVNYHHKR